MQKLADALDKALVMIGKQNSGGAVAINAGVTGKTEEETVSKKEVTKPLKQKEA